MIAAKQPSNAPQPAPAEYAGQWVAWDKARTTIVAHGTDLRTVYSEAKAAGHADAVLQHVRSPYVGFVGPT
jgi:hypothetical protein